MRMHFGKFRGVEVADLPDDYLAWLHGHVELREPLKSAVLKEFERRFTTPNRPENVPSEVRTMIDEIISAGYRKLALQHHPDHGGETKTMQLVNRAADFLRSTVRETDARR